MGRLDPTVDPDPGAKRRGTRLWRVAMEVSGGAWEVARILEPHVQRMVVVSPDDTGIAQARTKTDKLDPRTLARLLRSGELEAV